MLTYYPLLIASLVSLCTSTLTATEQTVEARSSASRRLLDQVIVKVETNYAGFRLEVAADPKRLKEYNTFKFELQGRAITTEEGVLVHRFFAPSDSSESTSRHCAYFNRRRKSDVG